MGTYEKHYYEIEERDYSCKECVGCKFFEFITSVPVTQIKIKEFYSDGIEAWKDMINRPNSLKYGKCSRKPAWKEYTKNGNLYREPKNVVKYNHQCKLFKATPCRLNKILKQQSRGDT